MHKELIYHTFPQGSDEWDNIRRNRLTGSKAGAVISTKELREAFVCKEPTEEELETLTKRAKKQSEVLSLISDSENKKIPTTNLHASGLKALVEKGFVAIKSSDPCHLKMDATRIMIDKLEVAGMKNEFGEWLYTSVELGEFPPTMAMDRGTEMEPLSQIEFENMTGLTVENVGFVINPNISNFAGVSPDGLIDNRKGVFEQKNPLPHTHRRYLREQKLPSEYKVQVHMEMAVCEAEYAYFFSHCFGQKAFLHKVMRDSFTESLAECLKKFESLYTYQLAEADLDEADLDEAKEMIA